MSLPCLSDRKMAFLPACSSDYQALPIWYPALRITHTLHASIYNRSHFRDPYTVRTPSVKVTFLSLA